jgi:uncharacterized membrane protein (DUF4010 family)
MIEQITSFEAEFYTFLLTIIVSIFCGFLLGIERTRARKLFGARDHIAYAILSTVLVILYENFVFDIARIIIFLIFGAMIIFLSIGSVYRLFHTQEPGYTSTISMLLAIVVGILSYYMPYLAIAISVIFLVILSTKKGFEKIRELKQIEWAGTVEFLAIVILLFILIPGNIQIVGINLRAIMIIFITILAIKYFSYFLLKSSRKNNLYYISFLGGFAHSEATTVELAEAGASSSSIWLVIQTMLIRMIIVLVITPELLFYAIYPILLTSIIGLIGSFLILRKKETQLVLKKVENPLSLKSALIFIGNYLLALIISILLSFVNLNIIFYFFIVFGIGLLSGGASSLFVASAFYKGLINGGNALIMLTIGLSAASLNKLFYSLKALDKKKNKRVYFFHLLLYITITIFLLTFMTIFTIILFNLPYF